MTVLRDAGRQGSAAGFVDPGELFRELALTGSEICEEFAQAAAQSTVVAIPKDAMETVLLRNAGLSLSITRYVGLRRRSLERRLKNLMFRSNRERIPDLLRELLEQYGRPVVEGILIDIRLSHQDLASLIGITRESVTLTLGELQNERMISIGRQRIVVLDRQRLIQAAGLSSMNDQNSDNNSDWTDCAPGTLTSLSTRLQRNRRRETIVKATMLAAAALLTIGAGRMFLQNSGNDPLQPMMYTGIACDDVVSKLSQWKKGELDEATAARIDEHLELCGSCAAKARALQAQRERIKDVVVAGLPKDFEDN